MDQIDRIEAKVDLLLKGQKAGKDLLMSEQEAINELLDQVRNNRSVVESAKIALEGYTQQVSDLTQKLTDAVAAGGSDVSPQIKEAADALKTNTEALQAAIPAVVQAVQAGAR